MIVPPRNTPRSVYQFFSRLERCIRRAQKESGSLEKQIIDLVVFGRCEYTPEQIELDNNRALELMKGIKPQ